MNVVVVAVSAMIVIFTTAIAVVVSAVVTAVAGVNLAFLVAATIALTRQDAEALVDVRCQRDER